MMFRRLLSRWRRTPPPAPFDAPLRPATPFAAIGDVHGRADLLDRLLGRLGAEAPEHPVVFVGDYIDRGEDSARVIETLRAFETGRDDVVCLLGNHEEMCLRFLDAPEEEQGRWMRFGGLQTLASYGVADIAGRAAAGEMAAIRDDLAERMGEATITWLRARPLWWQSGNVAVVHAAADPRRPLEMHTGQSLVWGHPDFGRVPRADGVWIVHGHTIVDAPVAEGGRISLDTGAYATGRLTAALISEGNVEFVTT